MRQLPTISTRKSRTPRAVTATSHLPSTEAATLGLALKSLVPGLVQFSWGQRDLGAIFAGSFLAALFMALLCWGTILSWIFLGFAYLGHCLSVVDLLKQRAFPTFSWHVAMGTAMMSLGVAFYAPVTGMLWLYACPTQDVDTIGTRYLVNYRAYLDSAPEIGESVWMRPSPGTVQRVGRVVAVEGQEVRWESGKWTVDGEEITFETPGALPSFPCEWQFRVPPRCVFVGTESTYRHEDPAPSLILVGQDQIVGQAWARYYPFWDRRLL